MIKGNEIIRSPTNRGIITMNLWENEKVIYSEYVYDMWSTIAEVLFMNNDLKEEASILKDCLECEDIKNTICEEEAVIEENRKCAYEFWMDKSRLGKEIIEEECLYRQSDKNRNDSQKSFILSDLSLGTNRKMLMVSLMLYYLLKRSYNRTIWESRRNCMLYRYGKNQYSIRGYYGPSAIQDLITDNMHRKAFYKKEPRVKVDVLEYGYRENGNLSNVKYYDSFGTISYEETLFYVQDYIWGFLWRNGKINSVFCQKYNSSGMIEYFCELKISRGFEKSVNTYHFESEIYHYSKDNHLEDCEKCWYPLDNKIYDHMPVVVSWFYFESSNGYIDSFSASLNPENKESLPERKRKSTSAKDQRWYRPNFYFDLEK